MCAATAGAIAVQLTPYLHNFDKVDDDVKGYILVGYLGALISLTAIVSVPCMSTMGQTK